MSDIQDYFEYIIKRNQNLTDNLENTEIRLHLKLNVDIISNF